MINKLRLLLNTREQSKILLLFILILMSSLMEMLSLGSIPVFIGYILNPEYLNNLIGQKDYISFINFKDEENRIVILSLLLVTIFLTKNILIFLINYFQAYFFRNLTIKNSLTLFKFYINNQYSYHLKSNPSLMVRNLTGDIPNTIIHIESLINLAKELIIIFAIFLLLIIVDIKLSLAVIAIISFITFIIYYFIKNKLFLLSKINFEYRGKQNKIVNHMFGAIKDIKILQKEKYFIDEFYSLVKGIQKINFFTSISNKFPRLVFEILAVCTMLFVTFYYFQIDENFENVLPIISLLALATVRLIPSFNTIFLNLSTLKKTQISFESIFKQISFYNNIKIKENNVSSSKNIQKIESIDVKDLYFKHSENTDYILKNINLSIKPNSFVGIIGKTGSGKTTLINLIAGLLEANKGQILVNKENIKKNLSQWYSNTGYISQSTFLLDETIKNNIALGVKNDGINISNLENALKLSGISEFVKNLPNTVNTYVGNQGVRLSGGQIQRIGIARALYDNSKVIFFDEATSSLDGKTEEKLIEDICKLKHEKTLIMISHKLSSLRNCDKVYYLKDNEIKDEGKIIELIERNPELKI